MQWAEFRGKCADDIARAWACMHDDVTAVGSVFEMKDGRYKAVYSIAGQLVPTVDGPFVNLGDAKKRVEFIVQTKVIRPRPIILDRSFM